MLIVKKIRRRLLRLEIWLGLAWARFLIKFVPFRYWRAWLGPIDGELRAEDWPDLTQAQLKQADDIGRIVNSVADRLRVFEAVCLPRAMVGRWVMARRDLPSRIIIGSRRGDPAADEEDLLFHAWLMVGDRTVTGENERAAFLEFRKSETARSGA